MLQSLVYMVKQLVKFLRPTLKLSAKALILFIVKALKNSK